MKAWIIGMTLALAASLAAPDADAARLGGGRSFGAQRSIASQPPSGVPARQAQSAPPTQQGAAAQGANPAPAGGLGRWAPLLGGLAVGGLLGALFGHSPLGGLVLAVMLLALLGFAAVALFRSLGRAGAPARPMQYAGLGSETVAAPPPSQAAGFDQPPASAPSVPPGFDVGAFLRGAKMNYVKLQLANDAGDLDALREFTTPEMFEELRRDIELRGGPQQTDVVTLNADLLEVATERDAHWASVRFSGMVRETAGGAPVGFEEVWNLRKPADGSTGWLLAGIQQMH